VPVPMPVTLSRRSAILGGLCLALPGGAEAVAGSEGTAAEIARRVVPLDLQPTEMLLSLGVAPAAVGNIPLYRRLVAEPEIPPGTPDVGPLQEPNLELLQHLKPDLILATNWLAPQGRNLERVAPVAWLPTFSHEQSALLHAETQLLGLGARVGREAGAAAWVARTEAVLSEARAALAAYTDRPTYVVRFMTDGRHAGVFAGEGMIGSVMTRLGFRNAYGGRTDVWGTALIGIEQLAEVPEARLIHFHRGPETEEALRNLAESPLWRALPLVREKRIVETRVVYPSGGLYSAVRFARQLARDLPAQEGSGG